MTFAYCRIQHLYLLESDVVDSPLFPCMVVGEYGDQRVVVVRIPRNQIMGTVTRHVSVHLLVDAQEFRLLEPHGDDTMEDWDKWRLLRLFDENHMSDHEIIYIDPVDTSSGTH